MFPIFVQLSSLSPKLHTLYAAVLLEDYYSLVWEEVLWSVDKCVTSC